MAANTIIFLLGWVVAATSALMLLPAVAALQSGELAEANVFLASFALCAFVGGSLVAGFRGRERQLDRAGAVTLAAAVWLVVPFLAAIPLYALDQLTGVTQAYFEAVSGFTTTGATVLTNLDAASSAVLLWRATLQWWGGAVTLVTAIVILGPLGVAGAPMHLTVPGYERGDMPASVLSTAREVVPVYAALTFACAFLLWLLGVPAFDAVCLSFSTLSTGGFEVRSGGIAAYGNPGAEVVLAIFMLIGATSILVYKARSSDSDHIELREIKRMLAIAVAGGAAVSVILTGLFGGESWIPVLSAIRVGFFRAVSLVTTTGFDNANFGTPSVPFVIALLLCAIGGAAYSTAGGLKQFRVMLLMSEAERELSRLVHPHVVSPRRIAGRLVDLALMKSVWGMLAAFLFAISLVAMALSFQGLTFENALIGAVASITNTGPLLNMAVSEGSGWLRYAGMGDASLVTLAVAMLLGRLEFLLLLTMLRTAYWRR